MAINKVVKGSTTLIDVTDVGTTSQNVLSGVAFIDNTGTKGTGAYVPITNPLVATTDLEMTALLVSDNNGKVVKFTGTSSTYETNAYYVIEEDV